MIQWVLPAVPVRVSKWCRQHRRHINACESCWGARAVEAEQEATVVDSVEGLREVLRRKEPTSKLLLRMKLLWISNHAYGQWKLARMHFVDAQAPYMLGDIISVFKVSYEANRQGIDSLLLTATLWNLRTYRKLCFLRYASDGGIIFFAAVVVEQANTRGPMARPVDIWFTDILDNIVEGRGRLQSPVPDQKARTMARMLQRFYRTFIPDSEANDLRWVKIPAWVTYLCAASFDQVMNPFHHLNHWQSRREESRWENTLDLQATLAFDALTSSVCID
ncbi:hypothetical protein PR001_g4798 [Phytophthora rubi]|uniref:Uncharacterized protein n=1 Tax=Phytophthora rubi TaxID=129364 RepID=A0A6A3NWJ4_9STRA|nr:hypothetical protein PR001_g4798 [Phytophthora rubi]